MTHAAPTLPGSDRDPYTGKRDELVTAPQYEGGKPPIPDYEPALEERVAVGGLWVSVRQCRQCGCRFPVTVGTYLNKTPTEGRVEDRYTCDRCTYATTWPTLLADVQAVMQDLRWRFDEYRFSIVKGEAEGMTQERFNRCVNVFFSLGPKLLDECERIYGDQLVAGVHAVATGGGKG